MSIISVAWASGANRDIHVLAGQSSRRLNETLFIFDSANPSGVLATTYLPAHPTVSIAFNALFKGAPAAGGIHVDPNTGQVSVDAALPPLHKNNFIIEVTVTDSSDASNASVVIRVHIHKTVTKLQLTPTDLTIRPSDSPLATNDFTSYRFTVRATFDDSTMGDLTTWHDVQWSPGDQVTTDGKITIKTTNAAGSSFPITATLLPQWGGASAQGTVHVGKAWKDETSMPKASIIPGGGWPGTTLPEEAPNILILGDGFSVADQSSFENIANTLVHFIKTDEYVRPFDVLCTSMNFWRAWMPSAQRGISFRCEVYPLDNQSVWRVPPAIKPPATGQWDLTNLIYTVGLPIPADMGKSASDLRTEWGLLVPAPPTPGNVNDDLIGDWKKLGKRGFIDEIDTFPGMAHGAPPAANETSDWPLLDLHEDRLGRAGLKSFFNRLASDNGVQVGTSPIGTVWADRGTYPFDNTDLIVVVTAHPGGRAANYTGYIAIATKSGVLQIKATAGGGSNFTLNFTDPPRDVSTDTSRTVTHEIGHSFGLGDEYADPDKQDATFPFLKPSVSDFGNLQRSGDVVDASNQIDGTLIRWDWLRVRKAAVVNLAAVDGPAAGTFNIPVQPGQGSQFAVGDIVLLRSRRPGVLIDYAKNVVELQHPLQVVSRGPDIVTVKSATAATITLADIQAFTPGSTLFLPVPMPHGMPGPTDPYARMVAKNVENLITSTHAPLYVRPPKTSDDDEQHPKLDGLTPGLPGRPFCFKVKTSIVGLYEGGATYGKGLYHPTGLTCMMRNDHINHAPFCPVCRYIMVELINPFQHFQIDLDYDDIYPLR